MDDNNTNPADNQNLDTNDQQPVQDEFKDKYLRALADYQNLERQTQVWKESYATYATADLIKKLLEVLDDLEKTQEHTKDQGLELVVSKLKNVLKSEGVVEIELEGKEFDPNIAEVISTEPGEDKNKIVKVLQKGYLFKDKTLRPAKVVVSA